MGTIWIRATAQIHGKRALSLHTTVRAAILDQVHRSDMVPDVCPAYLATWTPLPQKLLVCFVSHVLYLYISLWVRGQSRDSQSILSNCSHAHEKGAYFSCPPTRYGWARTFLTSRLPTSNLTEEDRSEVCFQPLFTQRQQLTPSFGKRKRCGMAVPRDIAYDTARLARVNRTCNWVAVRLWNYSNSIVAVHPHVYSSRRCM